MLSPVGFEFTQFLTYTNLIRLIIITGIIVVTILADNLLKKAISRYSDKIGLSEHVENILKILIRMIVFLVGVVTLLQYLGLGLDWLFGLSALAGAAIGFASTQTLGNFLAGFYLMISRPFSIQDYVNIGGIEGEVREISINYTEIYDNTYNLVEIPNRKVLDSNIINHSSKDDMLDYSFKISFPNSEKFSNKAIVQCILDGIDTFYLEYENLLPRKPEYGMSGMTRFERVFLVRVFYKKGMVTEFYDTQPLLLEKIVDQWDKMVLGDG
jgi:small-conductance mechanosensitive channel